MKKLIFTVLGGFALRWIQNRFRRQPVARTRRH